MIYDFIFLDKQNKIPLYIQLYKNISQAIAQGHIPHGEKLPSIRKLAQSLNISRMTVENAYQQLMIEGYITSEPQRGYFVLDAFNPINNNKPQTPTTEIASEPHYRYNFSSNYIDIESLHTEIWSKYIKKILKDKQAVSSYGSHQGEAELLRALTVYSHDIRGVEANSSRIIIGAGTQSLLYILGGLLNEKQYCLGLEQPGFPQGEQVFQDLNIPYAFVPSDHHGPIITKLAQSRCNLLYLNPSSRLSTGNPIPMSRRNQLLTWAENQNALIIEDDHNGELRYNARPIPALQKLNPEKVIYIGSFSKLLLPAVRLGYMVLPTDLAESYQQKKKNYNQTASKVEQLALAQYIQAGELGKRLRRLRNIYAKKSQLLITCLEQAFGSKITIDLRETTLSLVITLEQAENAVTLQQKAWNQGVNVLQEKGELILNFGGINIEDIPMAVTLLQNAWQ